ncbi:hypothetical protein FIBSPDRAFT_153922 [Athelia psychrophila]|uniref:Chorein N-terminal domain-containing protein n=1 Tax=Athelia psychrophila TaxID=1759441 RepID=A0A166BDZ6_9AGAM|nr:hypothetical protein FIBSPDRAFT_153922 [Fibularhizoctonia sp. CBS 109695]
MSRWYSWLSSISLKTVFPAALRRRLVAFAVKRYLQRALTEECQAGSQINHQADLGRISIDNARIDVEAINAALLNLPIRVSEGSAASLSIHGWHSSSSPLKLTIRSLRLAFHLSPATSTMAAAGLTSTIAESFVRDEIHSEDLPDIIHAKSRQTHSKSPPDSSWDQVPLIANLIRRVFASMEVDVIDLEITIVHPGCTSYTFSTSEWHLAAEEGCRKLTMSGLRVSVCDLRKLKDPSAGGHVSEETIMSSLDLLTLRLVVPPPISSQARKRQTENMRLTISAGVLGCAIPARHINGIIETLERARTCRKQSSSKKVDPNPTPGLDTRLEIQAIVTLLLPPGSDGLQWAAALSPFFASPLSGIRLSRRHVRVCLRDLSLLRTFSIAEKLPHSLVKIALTLGDVSIHSVSARQTAPTSDCTALSSTSNLRIDRNLLFQYPPTHPHTSADCHNLPTFSTQRQTDGAQQVSLVAETSPLPNRKGRRRKVQSAGSSSSQPLPNTGPRAPISLLATFAKNQQGHSLIGPIEIKLAPLAIYLDLQLVFCDNAVLAYLEEIFRSVAKHSRTNAKVRQWKLSINLEMVRLEVRCPPSSSQPRPPSPNSLILDFHNVEILTGTGPRSRIVHSDSVVVAAACERIVSACPLPANDGKKDDSSACMFLSLGSATRDRVRGVRFALEINQAASCADFADGNTVTFRLDIPSTRAEISKPVLDALQIWIRDVAQIVKRTFGAGRAAVPHGTDARVLWNRILLRFRTERLLETKRSENLIRVFLPEAFLRIRIPGVNDQAVQPLEIVASSVDVLVQLKPNGRDETLLTLGVVDASVTDHEHKLAYSAHRHLTEISKSTVQLRFAPRPNDAPLDNTAALLEEVD